MRLVEFRCENYKAFRGKTVVSLRPLTVFLGKNNSGKSTLLRLPQLLLRALSTRANIEFPLKVDELSYGESFKDLTHGALAHGAASFGVRISDGATSLDIDATIQNIQNMHPATGQASEFSVVSRLRIHEPQVFELDWEPRAEAPASYRDFGQVPFRGMLPEVRAHSRLTETLGFVDEWRERIQVLEEHVCYLGPVRSQIPRFFESGPFRPLGADGSGAVARLGQDRALLEKVSSWFQANLDGWAISLDYAGSAYRCLLRRGEINVNLADAGHGIQQVLPVVVQQLVHQTSDVGSVLDFVEQPELHLHAAAQAPLGDLFLETVRQGKCQVVVETHSENLLLRLRRRVAEGFDPTLIKLYFVEEHPAGYATVRPIEIQPDGSVDWWPDGVFSEGYEELKALNRANRTVKIESDAT
jgi:hypothetical protein